MAVGVVKGPEGTGRYFAWKVKKLGPSPAVSEIS